MESVPEEKDDKSPSFPNRIRQIRESGVKLTQKQLALLTGFDLTTTCHHESGERPLSKAALTKYAAALGVTPLELILDPNISGHGLEEAEGSDDRDSE